MSTAFFRGDYRTIFHTPAQFIGSGYQNAFAKEASVEVFKQTEDEKGTPFVEIDPIVLKYIDEETDECVKKMFDRMVKRDGNSAALFPFSRLSHSFGIGGMFGEFDPQKEKQSNQVLRAMLHKFKDQIMAYVNHDNERALQLAQHYIRALDVQLSECDQTDDMIDRLCSSFPKLP